MKKIILISALLITFTFQSVASQTVTFVYSGNSEKPIAGVKVTINNSIVGFTDIDGKVNIPETSGNYVLDAELNQTGEDPVDLLDAIWILQHAGELRTLTAEQLQAADVDGDGEVDLLDAIWILQHLGELRTLSPSLIFLDANTGNLLSETTFSPTDTPSVNTVRTGDVDQSFQPIKPWIKKGNDIKAADNSSCCQYLSLSDDGNNLSFSSLNENYSSGGTVRVFQWNGSDWSIKGNSFIGYKSVLSDDGNTLAISNPYSDGNGNDSGEVRVYDWSDDNWIQRGTTIYGNEFDHIGYSLSLNGLGNTVVFSGASDLNTSVYNYDSKPVRIYDWDGDTWTQRGSSITTEVTYGRYQSHVSIDKNGNTITIVEHGEDYSGGEAYLRVFEWIESQWVQKGITIGEKNYCDANGCYVDEYECWIDMWGANLCGINDDYRNGWMDMSIIISDDGNSIISGNGNKNSVKIFDWKNNSWFQRGETISGNESGYWANYYPYDPTGCPKVSIKCRWVVQGSASGSSTAISSDANTIAIGGPSDRVIWIIGELSGYAQIYDWQNDKWKQKGLDIIGSMTGDRLGLSISMNGNGKVVAVGALEYIQVYEWVD